MRTVGDLLEHKGRGVHAVAPDTMVFEAVREMAEQAIGALLVMDGDKLVGILSERDYARKCVLKNRSSRDTKVADIMTCEVVCSTPAQTVEECMALMTEKRIRHLPVIEGGRVIGIVSIGDLVKAIISEQKFIIEQLEHYIAS